MSKMLQKKNRNKHIKKLWQFLFKIQWKLSLPPLLQHLQMCLQRRRMYKVNKFLNHILIETIIESTQGNELSWYMIKFSEKTFWLQMFWSCVNQVHIHVIIPTLLFISLSESKLWKFAVSSRNYILYPCKQYIGSVRDSSLFKSWTTDYCGIIFSSHKKCKIEILYNIYFLFFYHGTIWHNISWMPIVAQVNNVAPWASCYLLGVNVHGNKNFPWNFISLAV